MVKSQCADFMAEVSHVWDKTRHKDSGFMCTIVQGTICRGDMVQFLNCDGEFIVEEEICTISYAQRTFEAVQKGDAQDDVVVLEFKHIWEYPINETKYIIKMDEFTLAEYKQKPKATLPINNQLPYQQLITKSVDVDEFIKKLYIYPLSTNLGYYFSDVCKAIGIECLRETKLGALYSVHKVKQGGLLYIFYARLEHSPYVKVTNWYYVQNKLSSGDFSSIKQGSLFSDVLAIDSAAQIYRNIYHTNEFLFNLKGVGLDTYHFLSDGIMKFHFSYIKATDGRGQLCAEEKKFVDFDDIKSIQLGERICSINGRILPIDRIE